MKIIVEETRARLFVNDATEATLVIDDLKPRAGAGGAVGLRVDAGTIATFSNLRIRPITRL